MSDTQNRPRTLTRPITSKDGPEVLSIVAAQAELESAYAELKVRAVTIEKYYKAAVKQGDPKLFSTVETEMRLYQRVARALVKPALVAYADAIRHAILMGADQTDTLLVKLLAVDAQAQKLNLTDASLTSVAERQKVTGAVAAKALELFRAGNHAEGLSQAVWANTLAEVFHCEDLPKLKALGEEVNKLARKKAGL
jgi:hypothetical protein